MKLNESQLGFAREHIKHFYASDFFPDADEYAAVWAGWDEVLSHYQDTGATSVATTPEDIACGKATGGFRIVHQLQPLDTLTYTALAGIIAPHLEERRPAISEGIACSYRVDSDTNGRFFRADYDGYGFFRKRSDDLATSHSWVLLLDIASFYNHIYVHRVEGAVEKLDPALKTTASALHEFLLALNDRVSIGIPVGPAASIILAEAVLNDLDEYLRDHQGRCPYTRYVDDFRIFSVLLILIWVA
jgi:hypothetical protein